MRRTSALTAVVSGLAILASACSVQVQSGSAASTSTTVLSEPVLQSDTTVPLPGPTSSTTVFRAVARERYNDLAVGDCIDGKDIPAAEYYLIDRVDVFPCVGRGQALIFAVDDWTGLPPVAPEDIPAAAEAFCYSQFDVETGGNWIGAAPEIFFTFPLDQSLQGINAPRVHCFVLLPDARTDLGEFNKA